MDVVKSDTIPSKPLCYKHCLEGEDIDCPYYLIQLMLSAE